MIYVASPYSDPDTQQRHHRYLDTAYVVAQLMYQKLPVFSPVVHCHEISKRFNLPGDAKYWQQYNTAFLRVAEAMYIVCLSGWETSFGVRQELNLARELGIPVHLVDTVGKVEPEIFLGILP